MAPTDVWVDRFYRSNPRLRIHASIFQSPKRTSMTLERILEPEVMDSAAEAADYDAMDHTEVNRLFVDDLLAAIQSPSLPPSPSLDILDLGTGTALITIELCKKHPTCRIMAADAAVSMLELARYNVEVNSFTGRIELAHVDAKKLPFNDAMFEVAMSNSIVHHIPEPIHVLREAVRVTKPGGLLFFRDLLRPDTELELKHLVATYTPGANDHQQRMFAESLHAALSLDEMRNLITSLDFSADTVQQTSDRHWTWCGCRSSL
jgi:ubiquinone/menaquinone biosynthesis C-methylase UbiE